MGWSGYGLYDGDGTQSLHYDFIKKAIPGIHEDEIFDMLGRKTKIPEKYIKTFIKNSRKDIFGLTRKNIIKWDEDDALGWQMLLSLFIDNNLIVPTDVLVHGILACELLLGSHADDFDEPTKRRAALKKFIKKARESCSISALNKIGKYRYPDEEAHIKFMNWLTKSNE